MTKDEPIEGTLLPDGTPLPKGLKDAQAGYSFFSEEDFQRRHTKDSYEYLYQSITRGILDPEQVRRLNFPWP